MKQMFALEDTGVVQQVSFGDTASTDAFSRIRISEAWSLFECQCQYNAEPLKLEAVNTNDGVAPAFSTANRMVLLRINAGAAGGSSLLQSFQYIPYQPGKSQFIAITGVMGAATAGAFKRYGYGDAANGIFYQQSDTGALQFNRRTSVSGVLVDNTVDQANWNIDPMDGTGPSGATLNLSNSFILIIDLQFLGMGRVRIGFDIDGVVYYAHQFLNANVLAAPYMQTATLPILAEIQAAAGLAAQANAFFKCAQVASEAGFDVPLGRSFAVEGNVTAASGARTHILSLRPRTTFATLANRGMMVLDCIDILAGTNPVYWELLAGGQFTAGPTWADVDANYSFMQYGVPASTWDPAGTFTVIASGYSTSSAANRGAVSKDLSINYPVTLNRAGAVRNFGTLHVLVTGISGASVSRCALNWKEIR